MPLVKNKPNLVNKPSCGNKTSFRNKNTTNNFLPSIKILGMIKRCWIVHLQPTHIFKINIVKGIYHALCQSQ